jgi:hypothetical protein
MTIDEAIEISWGADRYRGVPRPTVEEALERIEFQLAACGFNWLTGQAAREVLRTTVSASRSDRDAETETK